MDTGRAPRKVAIADHLWDAFEEMAIEMGADREALINQAMFMFARLNGFLTPGSVGKAAASGNGARPPSRARIDEDVDLLPEDTPARGTPSLADEGRMDTAARRRQVEERVLETAAELERQIKGRSQDRIPEPPMMGPDDDEIDDDEIVDDLIGEAGRKSLYIMAADGELDKVTKDRFLIGRGKHCDFIIQSGKVSREHAVITREGDKYYIEDLGSSNGTWFQKKRIKRKQIEDGDEFYICSEKVKCVIR